MNKRIKKKKIKARKAVTELQNAISELIVEQIVNGKIYGKIENIDNIKP